MSAKALAATMKLRFGGEGLRVAAEGEQGLIVEWDRKPQHKRYQDASPYTAIFTLAFGQGFSVGGQDLIAQHSFDGYRRALDAVWRVYANCLKSKRSSPARPQLDAQNADLESLRRVIAAPDQKAQAYMKMLFAQVAGYFREARDEAHLSEMESARLQLNLHLLAEELAKIIPMYPMRGQGDPFMPVYRVLQDESLFPFSHCGTGSDEASGQAGCVRSLRRGWWEVLSKPVQLLEWLHLLIDLGMVETSNAEAIEAYLRDIEAGFLPP